MKAQSDGILTHPGGDDRARAGAVLNGGVSAR